MVRRSFGGWPDLSWPEERGKEEKGKEEKEERKERDPGKRGEKRKGKKIGCLGFRKSKFEFIAFRFFKRDFVFDRLRRNFNFKKNYFESCLPKSRIY